MRLKLSNIISLKPLIEGDEYAKTIPPPPNNPSIPGHNPTGPRTKQDWAKNYAGRNEQKETQLVTDLTNYLSGLNAALPHQPHLQQIVGQLSQLLKQLKAVVEK